LGTPLSLNRRNLIFRVKVVESASLNLTLNSALTKLDTESATNNITLRSANVIPLYNPATLYSSINNVSTQLSIGDKIDYAQSLNNGIYKYVNPDLSTLSTGLNNLSLTSKLEKVDNTINLSSVKLVSTDIDSGTQNIRLHSTIYDTPILNSSAIYNTLNSVNHYKNLSDQTITNIALNGSNYYIDILDRGNTNTSLNNIINYKVEIDKSINNVNLYSISHLQFQSDNGNNNLRLLGSSYYSDIFDASQTAVSTVGLQYYADFYDASQTAISTAGSEYYVDFYDASQTAVSTVGSQYYVDFYDASQTSLTVLGSQYYVNFYDASQTAVSTVGSQYYVNFYDASQNAVSTLGSQYYVNYTDSSNNALTLKSSGYYVNYTDASNNSLALKSSGYYVNYNDTSINTSNIIGLNNYANFSDISNNSIALNGISNYINFGDNSISNNVLGSLSHNNVQLEIVNENLTISSLNHKQYEIDLVAQINGLNGLILKLSDYGDNVSFATSLHSITFVPNEYIKTVTQNSSVLTNLSMFQGPYSNNMTYNVALNNLNYSMTEYGRLVNTTDNLRKLVYEDESKNKLVNQSSNLKSLKYDDIRFEVNVSANNRLSSLRSESDINNKTKLSGSFKDISYTPNISETVLGSNTTFRSYSTASTVTFNSDSPTNYVNQVNIVYYMSGGNLTQSIVNYGEDLAFQVIGNSNPGLYVTNYDYNTPYRASFVTKNWPVYQYDTSSNWKLPVILNCSNDERKISATSGVWVEALLENGSGALVDEYGFSIDI